MKKNNKADRATKTVKRIGIFLGLTGMTLSWVLFSWKLTLVLFLVLWATNIENKLRE